MAKLKEKQNIPEGWTLKKLGELGVFRTGGIDKKINSKEIPVRLVNYMDVYRNRFITSDMPFMEVTAKESELLTADLQTGDVLFTPSSETPDDIGHSAVVSENLDNTLYSYHLYRLRFNKEADKDLDLRFKAYMCNSTVVLKQLEKNSKGVTRFTLSKEAFENTEVLLPPLIEQQKIAGILEAVDADIEETKSVIKATEKLKKGLMQKLFTKGIGHTKFKQIELGEIPESWKSVNLEDVADLSTGTTPSTSKTSYYEGNVPFIKTGQVVNNRITSAEVSISEDAVKDYHLKKYKPGTVLMAMYGQGKTRGQVALLEIDACTTQNAAAIEPGQNLNSEYLWFYFKSQYEQLRRGGVQGHISHLNLTVLKKVQLPLPSLPEQKVIVDILTAIDKKISVNKKLLAKQTELKKGLMQDLLSGIKRVSI